jgi:hypothetical protein
VHRAHPVGPRVRARSAKHLEPVFVDYVLGHFRESQKGCSVEGHTYE